MAEELCLCGHSLVDDHFFYNDVGLLTVNLDDAVVLACTECDCRQDPR